jgi:nicotinamide-nucleotide amidase
MSTPLTLQAATVTVGEALLARGWMVATAESCTGGMIARQLTELAGSSAWFERGFVTYSNAAKHDMLCVPWESLHAYGAVSHQVARAMVEGALMHSHAQFAVAVTGVAGPTGGSDEKPVGTVWFGFCARGQAPQEVLKHFEGDRAAIRLGATLYALKQIAERVALSGDFA